LFAAPFSNFIYRALSLSLSLSISLFISSTCGGKVPKISTFQLDCVIDRVPVYPFLIGLLLKLLTSKPRL
jgi:hypothetical protein